MELIDKSALIAEIDRQMQEYQSTGDDYWFPVIENQKNILSFLDTLKVKEVDVEKESELIANSIMISVQANLYHTNVYDYEKRCYKHSDLKDAARKGIELSLKTQKGE